MVVVELSDGLGNQMFQYAMGRALSLRRGDRLVLFTGRFVPPQKRQFGLGAFAIAGDVDGDLECLEANVVWNVRELAFVVADEVITTTCPNLILTGYWQSERYFSDAASTIRLDFAFREPIASEHFTIAHEIARTNSVCIHVRRGDYMRPDDRMGFLGLGYYSIAVRAIQGMVPQPTFYVFSDDIAWCRAQLSLPTPHRFIAPDHRTRDAGIADLQLMATCKHFIIANSTYSWWGAWLGNHEQKVVIAPVRWFRDEPLAITRGPGNTRLTSVDLIPSRWLRM
jgi:hypothetical protein